MIHHISRILELCAIAATVASVAYYLLAIWSAIAFRRKKESSGGAGATQFAPPVSILKPLRGCDPQMYETLRSHCLQDYPGYEIIFGVSDPADPVVELVRQLKSEFPQNAIRLVICRETLGTNIKVSNLIQMLREARYDYLIVNDSDIRVKLNYLNIVLAPLKNPGVGLVTSLYRGIANKTLGSKLESLGISTDFSAGVLVAQQTQGIKFGLGSTMAFRRRDLSAAGGFEAFVDYLADDYQIGSRIAQLGLHGELSSLIVDTVLPEYTMRGFLSHQLRWARAVRDSRFWGYLGLGLTFGLPWALLVLILARGSVWAWALLGIAVATRLVGSLTVGYSTLSDSQVIRFLPLIPLRDCFALLIWMASFAGNTVAWRGDKFKLKNGKLARAGP